MITYDINLNIYFFFLPVKGPFSQNKCGEKVEITYTGTLAVLSFLSSTTNF